MRAKDRYRKARKKKMKYGSDGTCFYCGKKMLNREVTIDHKLPKALGGGNKLDNLVIACKKCNEEKGMMDVETYRAHLELDLPLGERVIFAGEKHERR